MKSILFWILFLFALNLYSQESIDILIPNYPPYSNIEQNQGLWCEIIKEVFKTQNIQVRYSSLPLERMKSIVASGYTTALINSNLIITEEEKDLFLLSKEPFIYADVSIFYDKKKFPNGFKYNTYEDLSRYRIGVLRGTGSVKYLDKYNIKYDMANSIELLMMKQKGNRTDIFILADLTGLQALNDFLPEKKNDYKYTTFYKSPIYLIFSQQDPLSKKMFNHYDAGLKIIKSNRKYINIIKSYYPNGNINKNILPNDMK